MKLNIDEKTMDSPFAGYPWRHMKVRSRSINPIRSLMSADESLYLHWLAREYYQGKGKIIDGGPLLGGSTVALASGLEKNEKVFAKHKRIHSYDTFIYYDYMAGVCPPGLREGDNLLSFFRQNTQKYEDYIEVHAGDILQMHWNGKPIEILFLDIVKSWEINNHVIKEFFGHLIPNRSIVVHQDYYHVFCYWIHLTMQYLSPYFQATHGPEGATAGFMLTKEIPKELLEIDYSTFLTKQEAIELMDAALAPLQGIGKLYVMAAKVRLLTHLRDYEAARVLVDQIKRSTKHLPPVLSNELSFAEQEIVTHQLNSIQEAWVQLEQHPSSQNGRARIAVEPDKTTISQSKEEQETDWKRLAKEQQQLLLHLQQHINFQPVSREMIDRLSSEDISQFIAARKIIKALALKVAAKPGFGWLYKFSGLGKKILEE